MSSNLFTIIDNKGSLQSKNFIYMFNIHCQKQFNAYSGNTYQDDTDKIQLKFNDPDLTDDEQKELDFRFINLENLKENKAKMKLMQKCSEYRFRRASEKKWALEKSSVGSNNWIIVDREFPYVEQVLKNINKNMEVPTLVKSNDNDFVLIATNGETKPVNSSEGGKKKKQKKVRKHRGIVQTGGSKGKLKKGYRFSGKRLKNGLPEIVKAKKL